MYRGFYFDHTLVGDSRNSNFFRKPRNIEDKSINNSKLSGIRIKEDFGFPDASPYIGNQNQEFIESPSRRKFSPTDQI